MTRSRIAIIGGGHAGDEVAGQLRELGFEGEIVLFEESQDRPYERPELSKRALSSREIPATFWRRDNDFYQRQRIEVRWSSRVTRVTPSREYVDVEDSVSASERFSHVVLATGMAPRQLHLPGVDAKAIHYLQSLTDLTRFRANLEKAARVAIVGGGFIGAEVAASLRSRGVEITLIQQAERLMPRAVGTRVSEYFKMRHLAEGVSLRLGASVTGGKRLARGGHEIVLGGSESISADVLLGAIGVTPRSELARGAGLALSGDFVAVNQNSQSSHPRIFAVGDIALGPNPLGEGARVPIASLDNASWTASVAARYLVAGEVSSGRPAPTFWTEQYGARLQIAGLISAADRSVHRPGNGPDEFSVLHYEGDRIVAVEALGKPKDYLAVKRALSYGLNIPSDVASWPDLDLAGFIKSVMGGPSHQG